MWIIQLPFIIWCKGTKCASSRNIFRSTFYILLITWTTKHLRRNKELIKLVRNNVKTCRPFSAAAIVSRVCFRRNIQKLLSLRDNHIDSFFTPTRINFLWIYKQLINLDYDDMKNLTYILIICKCVQIVSSKKDWKALSMWDNHIYHVL